MSAPKGKAMPIAALIGMAHPDDGKGGDGAEPDGYSHDDARQCMEDFIAAVHDRDPDAALKAFQDLHDFCASNEPDGDEEGEGAEGEEG